MSDAAATLTVARLVDLIRETVESNFYQVTVTGEISNFSAPASGHWYFTLKDSQAQLRAVMFRGRNRLARVTPADGMQVTCTGTVSVYPARGEVQLIVDGLAPAGVGSLQAAFEALKARLAAEGLFAAERKRPLPAYPRRIGIATSPSGAALQDLLNILRRRAPGLDVVLAPTRVQGEGAAAEIAAALAGLNRLGGLDVLIVGRGGGSLEDLWAFNEESVARAIAASAIPVISAVGHETDFTIADLVADLRAPTPSAAAELVAKSRLELESHVDHLIMRLQSRVEQGLALWGERVSGLDRRLRRAGAVLAAQREQVEQREQRLRLALHALLQHSEAVLAGAAGRLDALSPLRQLARGYVIASHDAAGGQVARYSELTPGAELWLRFAAGRARAAIKELDDAP